MRSLATILLCACLAAALPAGATTPLPEPGFDARAARMERSEALYLEQLFGLLDEVAVANRAVGRRLLGGTSEGLHFEDYRARVDALLAEVERLRTPERLQALQALLVAAVRQQRDFFADWHGALDAGRPFDSQLTSEYGYHAGLHASQRKLLDAYGRMLALFPRESDAQRHAFHQQICTLDLACGGVAR